MSDSEDMPIDNAFNADIRELTGLWVRSQSAVTAYISAHVTDIHHAEDITQEVAQIAAEKFSEFDASRSFASWVLGIARHRVLKYYRKQSRDRLVLSDAVLETLATAAERIDTQSELQREALKYCMERIEGRRKDAVEMRYRDNKRVLEIAEEFHTSESAVSVMLFRVRKILLECIEKRLAHPGVRLR